jgi:hypothetical protein
VRRLLDLATIDNITCGIDYIKLYNAFEYSHVSMLTISLLSLNIGVLLKEWGLGMTGLVLENGKGKKAGEARFFSLPPPTMLCVIPSATRNLNIY